LLIFSFVEFSYIQLLRSIWLSAESVAR